MTRHALVIEDDEPTQFLLRSIAEIEGWECRHGETFADALAEAEWADVILLDLGLVGRSGVPMISLLHEAAPDTRIVVVTGREEAHAAALEAGADAFLTKPFEVTAVVDAMRASIVLDLRDSADAHDLPWFATAVARV